MFLAGLDTVAAMISWVMAFLAQHPDHYRQLVERPETIQLAVEELCRVSGVAMPGRACVEDLVYNGIEFKKGERLVYLLQISGINDSSIAQPEQVAFDRELSPHLIFGSGPHRCLGSHLARLEIRVFLQEWVKRIPSLSLEPGKAVHPKGGTVWVPESLPLRWPAAGTYPHTQNAGPNKMEGLG
jgi:cytochrome P450